METTLFIPSENDFRKWIREAIAEYMDSRNGTATVQTLPEEPFLSRKEVAKKLNISLVTLTDWVKRGLPSHKQRGRVYFLLSEVTDYIRTNSKPTF